MLHDLLHSIFKGLWGIHNNAGINGINAPAEWLMLKNYQDVLNINTLGLIDVTTTFLPLVKKEHGRIVNTASMMGRVAFEGMGPYCVSKYAVEAFSDALRYVATFLALLDLYMLIIFNQD